MAGIPAFPNDVISSATLIGTANTARDGSGTLGFIYTARSAINGGKGCRIDTLTVTATGTTTAGMVRFYVDDGTARLIREVAIAAITPSGTVKAANITTGTPGEGADVNARLAIGLFLKAGDILKASTQNAETFVIRAEGGEF